MANDREIVIRISADGTAAIAGIRGVGDATEKLGKSSALDSFKKNWLEVTAGITGAYLAFQKIWGLMDAAAEHAERMETLDALTRRFGTTAQEMVGQISDMSHGLIGAGAGAKVASDALAKGFSPQQVARMASVAATMHKVSSEGISAAEAFKSLEGSITAARERGVVKMMGATIDLASSMGKQYENMSKMEKAQAMLNAVTEQAAKVQRALGDEFDSAADRMVRFNNSIERMKLFFGDLLFLIGQPFMAIFQAAMTLIYGLVGAFDTLVSEGARVTDWLNITSGATERWAKKADTAYTNAAQSAVDAFTLINATWQSIGDMGKVRGTGESLGGGPEGNVKRAEQLAEIMRKIREAQTLSEAAEIGKSRIQADAWFDEQVKKLHDLGASDKEYSELVLAYAAKRHADLSAWATKTTDFYLAEQRRMATEGDKAEKDRIKETYDRLEAEAKIRAREAAIASNTAAAGDPSFAIRQRAEAEREVLAIRQEALVASITEQATMEETNAIMREYWTLEREVVENKREEAALLDARRLEIEREITDLTIQQRELLRQQADARRQESMGKIGAGALGNFMGIVDSINAGKDRYALEYKQWEDLQLQKIARLEELNVAESAINDEFSEFAVRREYMEQQRKISIVESGFAAAASLADSFYRMSANKSKAAFLAYQVLKSGETIVSTASAAMKAFDDGNKINYWVGVGYAAATVAMGAAQLAAIWSASPTGGGHAASINGSGALSAATVPAAPPASEKEKTGPSIINFYIEGNVVDHDQFARTLLPYLNKAEAAGVV